MVNIYKAIVVNKQKAIVGFLIAAVASYTAKYGVDLETLTVKEAIEHLVYGVIGYLGVYLKANK